jgi:hypothetical protein
MNRCKDPLWVFCDVASCQAPCFLQHQGIHTVWVCLELHVNIGCHPRSLLLCLNGGHTGSGQECGYFVDTELDHCAELLFFVDGIGGTLRFDVLFQVG